jgi:murein DD-endopeptidase MepM/ murein hydrolase activator NlpD
VAFDQLAYAPARPEGDTAHEREDLRLPRQRAAARTSAPGVPVMAGAGAAGLAPAPLPAAVPLPLPPAAPIPLPDAGPGVPLAGVPTYDPTAFTAPVRTEEPVHDEPVREEAVRQEPMSQAPVREGLVQGAPAVEELVREERATDPGAALCARIVGQATAQREAAARAEREAVEKAAAERAARESAERKVRERAAAARAEAEEKARARAEAAARADAERRALLAESYIKPVASCTLGAAFGETDLWANLHTGQDFTAPTGTPVHAVHGGTVSSAGWAGSYGYRVVLTLDDGTELWYCHLSTMVATEGRVTTGDTVGRVGATGNVPAPHLHLEVRPGGRDPIDPLAWLHGHDVAV